MAAAATSPALTVLTAPGGLVLADVVEVAAVPAPPGDRRARLQPEERRGFGDQLRIACPAVASNRVSGVMPTRHRLSRSASQQAPVVASSVVSPLSWAVTGVRDSERLAALRVLARPAATLIALKHLELVPCSS
jgi:hypothetical protein